MIAWAAWVLCAVAYGLGGVVCVVAAVLRAYGVIDGTPPDWALWLAAGSAFMLVAIRMARRADEAERDG